MGKVIGGMTISVDGFVSDRNGDVSRLYPDLAAMGELTSVQEVLQSTGAVILGRNAYDMGNGDFTGYEFQVPIFVLTHHPPETPAKGENERLTFTFVTEGVAGAVQQAKAAAGDKDVHVIGASTIQQCINAGLLDELHIDIAPVLLGDGLRLFENLTIAPTALEKLKFVDTPFNTSLQWRVITNQPDKQAGTGTD